MEKAVIYTRVSTEEQATENHHSLGAQKRLCEEFAKRHNYEIVRIFEDAGKSGKDIKGRPAFMAMIDFAKNKENNIKAVVVQHTDRFARNVGHHNLAKGDLKSHGVELLSISQPNLGDTPDAIMMDNVSAAFNQYWSDIISYKTRAGMEERVRKGWTPTAAPIGYLNAKDDGGNNIVIIDKDRAPFIKRMFELYVTGEYGGEQINDLLYTEGFRTKTGKKMQLSKLYWALENPFYYGDFVWSHQIWKGRHEPIISKKMWDLAQYIRRTRTMRRDYERKFKFLLSSFVFCGCGYRLTAEHHFRESKGNRSSKTFSYYHCTQGRKCTSSKYIPVKDLEKQVEEKFKEIQFSEEFYSKLLEKLKAKYDNHKKEIGDKKKRLNLLKSEIIKKRDKAEEMLFNEVIREDVYKRKSKEYEKEIKDIEDKISEFGFKENIRLKEFKEIADFSRNVYESYKKSSFDVKRMFLGFFWHKFIVEDKEIIEATPTPLFALLKQLQEEMNKQKSTEVAKIQKTPDREPTVSLCERSFINLDVLGE